MKTLLLGAIALVFAASCGSSNPTGDGGGAEPPSASATGETTAARAAVPAAEEPLEMATPGGDPVHGKALVAKFECNRCHDGTGEQPPKHEKQCFHCHGEILSSKFKAPNAKVEARWKEVVADLRDAPTLTSSAQRFRRGWLERFLLQPYDLRPHLSPSMPRLPLTPEEARDIAAYLGAPDEPAGGADPLAGADLAKGRKLVEAKGCPSCHAFGGVPQLEGTAKPSSLKGLTPAVALAPDLRTTRRRMHASKVIGWIKSPKAMKADTPMPEVELADHEVRDMAAYILKAKLEPEPPRKVPARLPVLTRKVTFDEVSQRIFRRTCWHCHGEPDYSVGDGGPGNTGGFGFKPRGLALTDYTNVASGFLDDRNERHSAFEKLPDGTPRMLATLLARQAEEAGQPNPALRGMPLGYPSLSPEDIQLLESWIDQGRPR